MAFFIKLIAQRKLMPPKLKSLQTIANRSSKYNGSEGKFKEMWLFRKVVAVARFLDMRSYNHLHFNRTH